MALVCGSDCSHSDCVELTDREMSIFKLICDSEDSVSFSLLKRSSNLHQELVSRIIKRLVRHSVVKKTDSGYACGCRFTDELAANADIS